MGGSTKVSEIIRLCQVEGKTNGGYFLSYCPWTATHICKCCGSDVCDLHWDSFNQRCKGCTKVIDSLPQ